MQVLFSTCSEAIEHSAKTKRYGCFYSDSGDIGIDIHLHECCEILFCLSGGKTFFIDERIYDVEDGDIFVINPFEAHKITTDPDKPFVRFVMQVNSSFLYSESTAETDLARCFNMRGEKISHKIATRGEETEKMCHIFRKLMTEYEYADDLLKNLAAVEFIVNVNKYFSEKNREYTYHSDCNNQIIMSAIKCINENLGEKISLDSVAKSCFVSVNELCRLFKQHMGTTVNKYITSRRMTEAKKLLKSGLSVGSAAEKCGFTDYTGFIRAFKRTVGMSPGRYKNQFGGNNSQEGGSAVPEK